MALYIKKKLELPCYIEIEAQLLPDMFKTLKSCRAKFDRTQNVFFDGIQNI